MGEDRDTAGRLLEADQDFSGFLRQVRKEENVPLEQLAEGLMTTSQLARIEKGQRSVSKHTRDRLMGRMGISSDLFENLLNIEDYVAWERQHDILCAIEQKEFSTAQELIAGYEQQEPGVVGDKIKQQFCLVMQAEILKQQGADQCEIADCYEKAVKLTVPDVEQLGVIRKLLSIHEVNMVLEYGFYHKGADFAEKCMALMTFVENSVYDDLSKVKIYPKIAYYYLLEVFSGQNRGDLNESLTVCSRAVEMLRDTGRGYYLLELLEMKTRIAGCIENDAEERAKVQDWEKFREEYRESTEMLELLKNLYTEYEVPVYMQDCAYLYHQRWVFYVGDVLRIRRKMYGLTQEELCGQDCSVRALRRAEKRETNMQHEALGVLLRKLGLSKEFQKARLAPNDREGLRLMEAIADCRNNCDLEQARTVLEQMREKVSDEIPENRQYFMEAEASLDWMSGRITKEQFSVMEEEALKCTLKVDNIDHMDEVYLTEMEMLCIRQRIQVLPDEEKRRCIDFLLHFFEGYEKKNALSDCMVMYEFIAICVISELGSLEEYQQSTVLAKKLLREALKCRRIWGIDGYLYEILWNEKEKMTESLRQCIILSHFCKQTFYEDFYYRRLHQS